MRSQLLNLTFVSYHYSVGSMLSKSIYVIYVIYTEGTMLLLK